MNNQPNTRATALRIAKRSVLFALAGCSGVFLAGCGGSSGAAVPQQATLSSIAVEPTSPSVAIGGTQQLNVIGTYSDGTTKDLTTGSTFVTSNATVATVSSTGLVTAVKAGSATITAMDRASGMTATDAISVRVPPPAIVSIALTPGTDSLAVGGTLLLTLVATLSDGSTRLISSGQLCGPLARPMYCPADWGSSDAAVATMDGLTVTAVAPGVATVEVRIRWTYPWLHAFAQITVVPASALAMAAAPSHRQLYGASLQTQQAAMPKFHHYIFVDVGTFGGPNSYVNEWFRNLNQRGVVVGASQTTIPQDSTANPFGCVANPATGPQLYKAFRLQDGVVHALGSLTEESCSNATEVNASGQAAGASENGGFDAVMGFNMLRAVAWANGRIHDLGTLGGPHSAANSINDRGQIVGFALNDVADPYSIFDAALFGSANGTQTRAFMWQNGKMQDLGTLGGPDALAFYVNASGQVSGVAYTTSIANSITGFPEAHPFLWDKGKMTDLGSFGGMGIPVVTVQVNGMNNRGQIIGFSVVPGEAMHPFLWDGRKLIDMMTEGAGGSVFVPNKINDEGAVVAGLVVPGDANGFEAGVWKDGVVTHLGALPGDCYSYAWSFGPKGQIGGNSASCDLSVTRAVLWEDGSIVDLNALIPAGSNLKLVTVFEINDRGEISGSGLPAGVPPVLNEDTTRAFLLIPCDEGHPDVAGCDYSLVQGSTATAPATARAAQTPVAVRMR